MNLLISKRDFRIKRIDHSILAVDLKALFFCKNLNLFVYIQLFCLKLVN
jgi:hypothetical protein